ncbi:AMP-binding protein [Gaetbulibacter aquiaggeris]|uniref:AMP-binding protein n=1 Tax=Gaetbulibacter aquiaggeris TaxID=1735373 RepID=A0ABW7MQY0_9FLAO
MSLLSTLQNSIQDNFENNAFFLNDVFYSYKDFAQEISNIRAVLKKKTKKNELNIGLVSNNDVQTYASIIALWMEGKAYVPLNPEFPIERNTSIIKQAEILTILDSSKSIIYSGHQTILTKKLDQTKIDLTPNEFLNDALAYILFTSGTTGVSKGVPITFGNLAGLTDAFWELNYPYNNQDKCLQMFELTFDFSVMAYLFPLLKGACIYTIPKDQIKYSYIYELMEDHGLTILPMVPSILHYLRPYFNEILCENVKLSLFCGEALPLDITEEWSNCIPNASIANVYGPTECTVFCTDYTYKRGANNKTDNGILSVGKDMKNTVTIIVDDNNNEVPTGEKGELCLSGSQLTPGYWKNEEKNKEVFFYKEKNGSETRFYRTGDLCRIDEDGDILYLGRVDFQAKIQGFRVELSEIEFHAKQAIEKTNIAAIAFPNNLNNTTEVGLVIESEKFETNDLLDYMKKKMPQYMIPSQIRFIDSFPLNTNGKTDRNKLKNLFN